MTTPKTLILAAAAALTLAAPARAAELLVHLDPAATEVSFDLEATGHDVHGSLALLAGELRVDPETHAVEGEVRVDAQKAETGNQKRDKTMHRKVLESEQYPQFVFRPDRFTGDLAAEGESEIEIHGEMEIHGDTHPMTMPAVVRIDGGELSASAKLSIPFVEWGMHDPSFLMMRVAKVVEVGIEARGSLVTRTASTAGAEGADGR